MEASSTYRQLGKLLLAIWEKPKRMEAVHQPARSLLEARASMFWSKPRKRNSSGHAVKKKMPSESNGSDFHALKRGANSMKWMARPRGMAMQPKTMKLAGTKTLPGRPQAME